MLRAFAVAGVVSLALVACGGSKQDASTDSGAPAPGTPEPGVGGPAPTATQRGVIVNFDTKKPVDGAKVVAGDQSVITAADGSYAFTLPVDQAFEMTVTKDGFAQLIEQETKLEADFDRGPTRLVEENTASLLTSALTGYDAKLGILSIQLIATGGCASVAGATVSAPDQAQSLVKYTSHGLPSPTNTEVGEGEFPSAIVYNVKPNEPVKVKVEHPTCKVVPFPTRDGGLEYTGGMTTAAGFSASFARIFLE